MSDEDRRALRPGDIVTVRLDDGSEAVRHVKYAPWRLGHGAWVVGFVGVSGGYDLGRVTGRVTLPEGGPCDRS